MIRLHTADEPTPAPSNVPNLRAGIRRLDTITAFKSPDYLQKNPLEKNKVITPHANANKAKR